MLGAEYVRETLDVSFFARVEFDMFSVIIDALVELTKNPSRIFPKLLRLNVPAVPLDKGLTDLEIEAGVTL